jgi:conjugal transfer/entry exclusion protein
MYQRQLIPLEHYNNELKKAGGMQIMLKKCSCILVALMALTVHTPKAEAVFGVGDIVFDPTNNISAIATEAHTLLMQTQEFENFKTNLTRIADGIFSGNLQQIAMTLGELSVITHPPNDPNLGDVSLEYDRLEKEWDKVYNIESIIKADNPKSAHDYALRAQQMMEITKMYTRRAKSGQGIISQMDTDKNGRKSDATRLSELMEIIRQAPGTLAAQQASQQIELLKVEQAMRMQYLMGDSQHAQAAQQAEIAVREEMAQDTIDRFYSRTIVNYNLSDMSGSLAGLESLD